jgi:hypothetical protein
MIEAEVDSAKNVLRISYARRVTPEETKQYAERIASLADLLQPGFRALTDLSHLESMDLECAPHIEEMMDLFGRKGISLVVRVVPDPHKDIGLNIMSLFHYQRRVRIVTCETMQEAQRALEG